MGRVWGRYSADSMDVESYDPRYDEPEEEFRGDDELVSRMEANDYSWCSYSCEWEKVFSVTYHNCTKNDHKDGKVKLGQRYKVIGTRIVQPDGTSKQVFNKKVIGLIPLPK